MATNGPDRHCAVGSEAPTIMALVSASVVRVVLGVLLVTAEQAGAVPVPFKNCGKSTDVLQVTKLDASVWPPPTAAPLAAVAVFDPGTGQLSNLHMVLDFGTRWVFDSGPVATSPAAGFVPLPGSLPVAVTGPGLPIPAGPVTATPPGSTTDTFFSPDGLTSVSITTNGTLAQSVASPITSVTLTFNGNPGFPLPPPVSGTWAAHVQMTLPGGQEVFCMDLVEPLKNGSPVTIPAADIPTLSPRGAAALVLLLVLAAGATLLRWRSAQTAERPRMGR